MRKESTVVSSTSDKTFYQMTIMCLSASFLFLITTTPSIMLLIGKPYWLVPGEPNEAYDIAKAINNQLVYFNHSINFFLYCVTGQRFRMELVKMFRCGDNKPKDSMDSRTYRFTDVTKSPRVSRSNLLNVNGNVKYQLVGSESGLSPGAAGKLNGSSGIKNTGSSLSSLLLYHKVVV